MKQKKWYIMSHELIIISHVLDSFKEALELFNKIEGFKNDYQIVETIYG